MKKILLTVSLLYTAHFSFGQNVVQAEYFLDNDLGFGNNTLVNVVPSPDGTFPFTVNLTNATAGDHKLYIRTKASDGKWSETTRRNIQVVSATKATVTGGEYFFDADPGFGAARAITISPKDSAIMQDFTAIVTSLSPGYHKLYIRLKNVYGYWGLTARRNVEIINAPVSVVKSGEYFFNADPGVGNAFPVTFATPLADGTFSFNIPLGNIPTGADTLFIRVKDSVNQNWSLTQWQTDSLVTSLKSGLWSDINTWSNHKIPTSNTVVILHHDVTVDINGFCKSLTPYRNDVHVTVNQGMVLNVTGH